MADKGEAWQNGYAERLIPTIKEEEVNLSEYPDYHAAYQQIGRFLDDVYIHKRIQSCGVSHPSRIRRPGFQGASRHHRRPGKRRRQKSGTGDAAAH
jgi:hypothetical protein